MKKYVLIFLAVLLCISLFMTISSRAATTWSDDFNDGDYRGWTVDYGTFSAADKTLKTVPGDDYYEAYYFSSVASGTWSFDLLVGTETDIFFMYNPLQNQENQYEGLEILWFGTHIRLYSYSSFYNAGSERLGEFIFSSSISGWQHLDITRSIDGRICIYHNRNLILDVVDPATITSSVAFVYLPLGEAAIDNIVVSNTVDIEPPPPVPIYMQTWFLAIVAAVALAMVVMATFFRRKRT